MRHKKEKQNDENIATQASTSTNFTKQNKMLFYKTISSNFSREQYKNENIGKKPINNKNYNSVKKSRKTQNDILHLPNFKSINETQNKKRRKSIVTLDNSDRKEEEKNKDKPIILNSLLPTNINSYHHLIRGTDFGVYDNLNWALRLRDYSHKGMNNKVIDYKDYYYRENKKTNEIKQEKVQLTENFNPPSYYDEDLNKYKKKVQLKKSLIAQLNPDFSKIKHLLFGNNNGKVNYSQFNFETTLRNIKSNTIKNDKKWEILPVVKNQKYITKFMAPITLQGIQNLKNIDKFIHKTYDYSFKDVFVGESKIKKKIKYTNRNFTISGIGETLGDEKYNNHFGDNNMFANKRILSTESNPQCKFELGLRIYSPPKDRKYMTHTNFRLKKK